MFPGSLICLCHRISGVSAHALLGPAKKALSCLTGLSSILARHSPLLTGLLAYLSHLSRRGTRCLLGCLGLVVHAHETFAELGLPTGAPQGAFYAFPDIRSTGLSDEVFAERLLTEEHVAVIPGSSFGASGVGHVRICYATSEENLREALVRIGGFVAKAREVVS